MNNLKPFLTFIKESKEQNIKGGDVSLVVKNDTLTITVSGTSVTIPMKKGNYNKIKTRNGSVDGTVYRTNYNELHGELLRNGISLISADGKMVSQHKMDNKYPIVLVVSTDGNDGKITSRNTDLGADGGVEILVADTAFSWGLYFLDKDAKDNYVVPNKAPTKPFSNFKFTKKGIVKEVEINDGFIIDKTNLTNEAKAKIKSKLKDIDRSKKVVINTGASKDDEDVERDYNLVIGRYGEVRDYLKSLGFKQISPTSYPKSKEDTKNIYGKFTKDLKSSENRNLTINIK